MTDNIKLALVEKLTPEMARDLLRDDQNITLEQLARLDNLEDTLKSADAALTAAGVSKTMSGHNYFMSLPERIRLLAERKGT